MRESLAFLVCVQGRWVGIMQVYQVMRGSSVRLMLPGWGSHVCVCGWGYRLMSCCGCTRVSTCTIEEDD